MVPILWKSDAEEESGTFYDAALRQGPHLYKSQKQLSAPDHGDDVKLRVSFVRCFNICEADVELGVFATAINLIEYTAYIVCLPKLCGGEALTSLAHRYSLSSSATMTHESLITNLTLYYQTLAALHHISPANILPLPTPINIPAAHEAGLSPSVISLLQRLPQLHSDLNTLPLLPDGTLPVFYADDDLDWSRRPTFQDEAEISGDAFMLSYPNIYGTALIYDTVSEKLLHWEAWGRHVEFEIAEIENPFEMEDAKAAGEIIGPWIEKLLKLEWVPFGNDIVTEPEDDDVESAKGNVDIVANLQLRFIKSSIRQIYKACGWNTNARDLDTAKKDFDDDLFEIKKQDWMEQTQKILDQAYEEQWKWLRIRTELNLDGRGQIARLDNCLPEGQQMRHLQF